MLNLEVRPESVTTLNLNMGHVKFQNESKPLKSVSGRDNKEKNNKNKRKSASIEEYVNTPDERGTTNKH